MHAFTIAELLRQQAHTNEAYLEFLRVPSLSVGVYTLAAGVTDPQGPHSEDEVYYIVQGRGSIRVADEDRAVASGALIYVAANVEHRFHSIVEDLTTLVFFAPAEHSMAGETQ